MDFTDFSQSGQNKIYSFSAQDLQELERSSQSVEWFPRKRSTSPAISEASSADVWCQDYPPKGAKGKNSHFWRESRPTEIDSDESSEDENTNLCSVTKYRRGRAALQQMEEFYFFTYERATTNPKVKLKWNFERLDWFGLTDGNYCGKQVALKYLHLPQDLANTNLNLEIVRSDDLLRLPIDFNENINEILMHIMDSFYKPSLFHMAYPIINFVCSRLEMYYILGMAYLHDKAFDLFFSSGITFSAVRRGGLIYLASFNTDEVRRQKGMEQPIIGQNFNNVNTAGLMFHKHLLSESPDVLPDLESPYVRKDSELFSVDQVMLGDHTLLVQNKFKAIRSDQDKQEFGKFAMFELKTASKPYVLRTLFPKWLRCLAGNMSNMIIGIRDRYSRKIVEIDDISQEDLLKKCQELFLKSHPYSSTPEPRLEVCLQTGSDFLNYVQKVITEDTPRDTVYTFEFSPVRKGKAANAWANETLNIISS
ncbi:uncharacterized protein LOC132199592 [Neocloeon triangulifer]|uniref:uncharacterized protein LOC132199592 n=1 Tax=Neocloeon triangulifer TaxID=2078957 RepID=UPI00286EE775|nr:uncharacterized protein LOC132199592 [Neocloeon triangulifer]XP_059480416.1 uncharacterized protein LOC132199592 [Neocloeon triangulifer]XP_059480417.1 uncharacterized protein LOC132199592 [Neocloeon triangulifer]XP_059480418.1 uncharacterized protein LOC132199592 [Neocloeon triangulifer]